MQPSGKPDAEKRSPLARDTRTREGLNIPKGYIRRKPQISADLTIRAVDKMLTEIFCGTLSAVPEGFDQLTMACIY